MSDQALDLAEASRRYEKAMTLVADLCTGQQRWKMTIPVDLERDSDITLTRSLNDVPALLDEVERLTGERDRARDAAVALEQELALKDEALDQIRALHSAVAYDEAGNPFCAHSRLDDPCEVARVLSSLASRLEDQQ